MVPVVERRRRRVTRAIAIVLACVFGLFAQPTFAQETTASAKGDRISAQAAVALVETSPQLKIDRSVPAMDAFPAKTHPYVTIAGAPEGTVGGYLDAEDAHQGRLADGEVALAIPLDSGGSGGVFTQIVFVGKSPSQLSYAGYVTSGGHADVEIKGGTLVARIPEYGRDDANCCPSRFLVTTYAVVEGKLHETSHVTVPAPPRR
jgi:hypothetical protein